MCALHAVAVALNNRLCCLLTDVTWTSQLPAPSVCHLQVVALRSQQLKAEQAYSQAEAAEAKLAEAGQQLASLSAQLSTETARAQQLAGEINSAKQAEKVGGARTITGQRLVLALCQLAKLLSVPAAAQSAPPQAGCMVT